MVQTRNDKMLVDRCNCLAKIASSSLLSLLVASLVWGVYQKALVQFPCPVLTCLSSGLKVLLTFS